MSEPRESIVEATSLGRAHAENSVTFDLSGPIYHKEDAIRKSCDENNIEGLVRLSESPGGLLNDTLRRTAWPILIGSQGSSTATISQNGSWKELPRHRDEDQVEIDVNRAFIYYPNDQPEEEIEANKAKLLEVIVQVLRRHPMLCYFQGYHDIVQVLLLVLGEHAAPDAVARLSLLRIRDYMLPSLSPALRHLHMLPAILEIADPVLASRLSRIQPFFALAATLTLYAHDIQEFGDIARLFDFILAHEPVIAIYTFAAIIVSRRGELLQIPVEETDMLHFTLSKLPQLLDLEDLISKTLDLFERCPPERLPRFVWWRIPSNSVLKTSRSHEQCQTLDEGELLFYEQVRQLRRQDQQAKALVYIWRHRRAFISVAAAFLVGIASIWLRRSGYDRVFWIFLGKARGLPNQP